MLVLSVLILLIYVAVQAIWSIILPFLLAGIFAYVMMPLVRFFQYTLRLRSRGLSVILTLLLLGAVVYLAVIFIIPSINAEIEKTLQVISGYSSGQDILTMILPRNIRNYLNGGLRWGNFPQQLSFEKVLENVKLLLDQVGGIINSTLSIFSWGLVFLIGFIYFVFILLDFENLARGFISLFPKTLRPTIRTISMDLDRYMNNYFRGQALVAMSVGILLSIGFNIIGLPLATAMGIFIGILNFIPYMQALGIIPLGLASLLMAAQTGENAFVCMLLAYGVLMIVQIIQDMIIVPHIMGQTMGMRPSLILLVLSIWGYLLGFFGMLIALPITMFIYSLYMRYVLQDEEYIEQMRLREEKRKAKQSRRKKRGAIDSESTTSDK
ncbi:MAG: AI-2E family transporter [Porphyromonadaceae bacterium]|nr:AI-2E family transporter [Porphyromonadaceae bacterium]